MTATLDSSTVVQYLTDHPRFFEEHAALLGNFKLSSPLTGRAVSLQERQMEVMREKHRVLELRMAELTRLAKENAAIGDKFHGWTRALLQVRQAADLPRVMIDSLQERFGVPQATLRLWNVAPDHLQSWFAQDVSDDARLFANSLRAPYCGSNHDFEAVRWLEASHTIESTVIVPLRAAGENGQTFGLLIMGSPDPQRFTAEMATDFLVQIGETASATLGALQA